jgi:hypothetical protein
VLRDLLRFYVACLRRAFSGTYRRVEGWTGGLLLAALLFDFLLSPSQRAERLIMTDIPAVFCLAAFVGTVAVGLVLAPFQLFQSEMRARKLAEERLRPKLSISLSASGASIVNVAATTAEMASGRRQTISRSFVDAIFLDCENLGETKLHGVRARVMAVRRRSAEGPDVKLVESIELPWGHPSRTPDSFTIDMAPADKRRLWLGHVRSYGYFWVFRRTDELPADYQQVFGAPGIYRILIQVDSDDTPPIQALLEVETKARPEGNGVTRGIAEVSLLEQASPRVVAEI